jgi:hypothetical protein
MPGKRNGFQTVEASNNTVNEEGWSKSRYQKFHAKVQSFVFGMQI